jgi:metal-dependent HD superfamily phosphatase/phosphodiesterase
MGIQVPARGNKPLASLLDRINDNAELVQLWKCANMNAVDRCGISDHGQVHIQIIANAALKILRFLVKAGVEPNVVKDHGMASEDAEVIVVLAACLHDLGISIHRDDHERYSLFLAYPKARELLDNLYEEPEITTIVAETMHAIIAHNAKQKCLTIEAGVLKVADALDMTEGRSRIPFEAGAVNIHSVSARAVQSVQIEKGDIRPVKIVVSLSNSAGIFQVDELLGKKLKNSTLEHHVEVMAKIEGETEPRLIEVFRLK